MRRERACENDFPLLFVRRTVVCASQERDGVAVLLPFLGVSSLDFGPLLMGRPFFLAAALFGGHAGKRNLA